jgi:4-oxalocrotonate tautomerase
MPIIEVKAFDRRFDDPEQSRLLIERLTDALVSVYGEAIRPETWVLLDSVAPEHWGFGGEVRD